MADDTLPTALGFIGIGAMGYPMARNLAQKLPKEAQIFIYDVVDDGMTKLVEEFGPGKIVRCSNSKEVAERAQTTLTMLPEGTHVRTVYLDPQTGILSAPDLAGKHLIDASTIDTETSLHVRSTLQSTHPTATFHDAPVSGGTLGAEAGTLTFMLGCAASSPDFPRLERLLGLMGSSVFPCGGPALGLTAKLCNNYCSALITLATSEALNIGIRCGMDPRVLSSVFQASTAGSTINEKWNPVPGVCPNAPASRDYEPGFRIELMRKDFKLACEAGERVGARMVLGPVGLGCYEEAMESDRCRGRDSRVVYRWLGGDEGWRERFGEGKGEGGEEPH